MTKPYTMRIWSYEDVSQRHGFHLGTDVMVARDLVVERFASRIKYGLPTVHIALISPRGAIEDIYDGEHWNSEKDDG